MKAVLIDDEYYALQGLKMRLDEIGEIEIVGTFTNGKQALENIEVLRPDVIFLDIEMSNISGIELFPMILEVLSDVKIVFMTAYARYAVEAFELNAIDYIVKPIEKWRLLKTLERIRPLTPSAAAGNNNKMVINCFRKLSIVIDGKETNVGLRKKSEELLAYLICAEGRFVAKEKIMEALWPEVGKDNAANNLYVAFYNLKQQNSGVFMDLLESVRGKMRWRPESIECDLYEFKRLARLCNNIDGYTIEKARKAAELYQGKLFEENYYAWATLPQAEMDVLYLELLEKAITYCRKINDVAGARYFEMKKENFEA